VQTTVEAKVIYGSDNRLENYQATDALRTLASSTVALVKRAKLSPGSQGQSILSGSNFGSSYQLCSSEPYREQTSGAFCSGSLVAPDVIITAGHCITDASDCADVRFIFDFALLTPGSEQKTFSADQIYACKEIIHRQQVDNGADFAVIRLDRKVTTRAPLRARRTGSLSVGERVLVIGHPAGLPQKIAGGAQVRAVQSSYYTTNLDTYGGNSGSAVFNAVSMEVEGILVRGENDFVRQGSCSVSNRCTDTSCRGEDVTRIDQVLAYLPSPVEPPPLPPAQDEIFTSAANINIPDYPKAGVESAIQVDRTPNGRKVQIQLDLTHTYRGDLLVQLLPPNGKIITLHKRSGGSLDDIRGTYGVDLVSSSSLASLSTISQTGSWKLRVTDQAKLDIGTLKSWSVIFK
jgi:subtilisin-like proprotein convertase family protein